MCHNEVMSRPLKESINTESVRTLATGINAAWRPFPVDSFVHAATVGLDRLELKDRVRHVSLALRHSLDLPFPQAAAALSECTQHVRLDMWSGWPATDYLGANGLDHLDDAMAAIAVCTPFTTGEMAVRPYLDRYRDDALKIMCGWTESPDEHLRRLASEGSRPRLPWASRVPWLMEPGTTFPLLDLLREDPSEYVRRSVANHVNDVAKDHPEAAVSLLARWRAEGGVHVEKVLRHAARGMLRTGDPAALSLMGAVPGSGAIKTLDLASTLVPIGEQLQFTIVVSADAPGPLILKYTISREGSQRTFHLSSRTAHAADHAFTITKSHSFRPVTTRNEPEGPRTLQIVVNGTVRATAQFTLTEQQD